MSNSSTSTGQGDDHRDRGLLASANARALWDASVRSQPMLARLRAAADFFLRGERPEPIPAVRRPVEPIGATGICCSGGGIRSAAYNLGALQALQRQRRLQRAHYLAAVSGGSYIAAAYCMLAKTWKECDAGSRAEDSNPELLKRMLPFAPGSPEEQYVRNRSSYLAPDGSAKIYLGARLLLGLLINLLFLGLPLVALTILAAVAVYVPYYGGDLQPPPAAWLIPGATVLVAILAASACVLRRPPNDGIRRASEIWCSRLLVGGALAALLTLVLPALAGADVGVFGASRGTVAQATGGSGVAGLVAGLVACLREVSTPRRAVADVGRARGWLARLAPPMRRAVVHGAAAVAGPLLLLTTAVATLAIAVKYEASNGSQWLELRAAVLLAVFCVLYRVADLTSWSLHPFYKRRLCTAFALKRILPEDDTRTERRTAVAQDARDGIAVERDFNTLVPLSQTALCDGPTLIVCAAANISDPGATPPGRRVTSFTFSAETIGGPLVGALETTKFEERLDGEHWGRDLTLPAAVAMSGAAISPSSGKTGSRALTFLLTLANMRLGVWVPNPRWVAGSGRRQRRRYKRPRPWYLVLELLGRNRLDARYLYVSDGGHYENLGLVELLRRGCTRIYCFDASGGQTFSALGDAVALARSELGVEIEIDPQRLMSTGDPLAAEANAVTARFRYASGEEGILVYARNVVVPDAPWDVRAHQLADPRFPNDSTVDQLYTDQKFESYRALGECAGQRAIELMDRATTEARPKLAAA
ncbi:MAG: hypothetical protein QOD69_3278 [Solirubrobacteraceae bacterium]|jgi:hypothetical protein|nr:hypothetical protein [Solirubrobacteraceae bacterium]